MLKRALLLDLMNLSENANELINKVSQLENTCSTSLPEQYIDYQERTDREHARAIVSNRDGALTGAVRESLFGRLGVDIHLELLKYMPIKERVLFERINTNWARLLDRLWLSQKTLEFFQLDEYSYLKRINATCSVDGMPAHAILNIIRRCHNLVELKVDRLDEFLQLNLATQLANVLNSSCKKLECLLIWPVNAIFFELFKPTDKLICLQSENFNLVKLFWEKNRSCGLVPMKWLRFLDSEEPWTTSELMEWDSIDKLTVEYLEATEWNAKFNELINLKILHVGMVESHQIGNFQRLESISLRKSNLTDDTSITGLRRIFESNPQLVSLNLWWDLHDGDIVAIFDICSNLKSFVIRICDWQDSKEYTFWPCWAKLTKLRKLDIQFYDHCEVDEHEVVRRHEALHEQIWDGLAMVLRTCTKLKFLRFQWESDVRPKDLTDTEKEELRKLAAAKSKRQSFVATFVDPTPNFNHIFSDAYVYVKVEPGQ